MSIVDVYETFDTEQQAQERKQAIIDWYPPGGYGTSLRVYQQPDEGKWVVYGYHYSSCD